jgi:hypothetical protein
MNRCLSKTENRGRVFAELKRYWLTIGLSVLALMLFVFDSSSAFGLTLDSASLELSLSENILVQLPQLLLSHFRHWSAEHLFWDLAMFAVLAAFCERISRIGMVVVLATGVCSIPLAVGYFDPTILTYRGLSGLDTALFAMAAVYLALTKFRNGERVEAWVYAGLLLGMVLKTAHELTCGTVFVASTNFVPVPVAHIVGAMIGAFVGLGCFGGVFRPKVVVSVA